MAAGCGVWVGIGGGPLTPGDGLVTGGGPLGTGIGVGTGGGWVAVPGGAVTAGCGGCGEPLPVVGVPAAAAWLV